MVRRRVQRRVVQCVAEIDIDRVAVPPALPAEPEVAATASTASANGATPAADSGKCRREIITAGPAGAGTRTAIIRRIRRSRGAESLLIERRGNIGEIQLARIECTAKLRRRRIPVDGNRF